jgi:hypothetical protein
LLLPARRRRRARWRGAPAASPPLPAAADTWRTLTPHAQPAHRGWWLLRNPVLSAGRCPVLGCGRRRRTGQLGGRRSFSLSTRGHAQSQQHLGEHATITAEQMRLCARR